MAAPSPSSSVRRPRPAPAPAPHAAAPLLTRARAAEDGKEMLLDAGNMTVKDLVEEVDRHSRMLSRKEELSG